jgi:multiple sugar transport system permease protein
MLKRVTREIALSIAGLAVICVLGFPLYWTLSVAVQNDPTPVITPPHFVPTHLIFSNIATAWDAEHGDLVASLIISSSVVVIGIMIGVPTAYALRRFRLRYANALVIGVLLVTQMVPAISLALGYYSLFDDTHMLYSYWGIIFADSTYAVPLMVLLLRAFLQSVPDEIFDAARLDGCNELRLMFSVIMPISMPAIATASLFGFIGGWGDFLFGYTLDAGGGPQPVTLGIYKFISQYNTEWGPVMGTVVLSAIPAAVILAFGQRYVRSGLRAGALM